MWREKKKMRKRESEVRVRGPMRRREKNILNAKLQ